MQAVSVKTAYRKELNNVRERAVTHYQCSQTSADGF